MHYSYEEALSRGWITPADLPKNAPKKATLRKTEFEGKEQADLIKQFRLAFPQHGFLLIHIPNGGSRKNAYEGWRLKEQGVRAGVSDLFLPVARKGYHGLWLEFKASPPNNAPVSDSQKEWLALMQEQGYAAYVCVGVSAAMARLRDYLTEEVKELQPT